jgi:hypothetical protein
MDRSSSFPQIWLLRLAGLPETSSTPSSLAACSLPLPGGILRRMMRRRCRSRETSEERRRRWLGTSPMDLIWPTHSCLCYDCPSSRESVSQDMQGLLLRVQGLKCMLASKIWKMYSEHTILSPIERNGNLFESILDTSVICDCKEKPHSRLTSTSSMHLL